MTTKIVDNRKPFTLQDAVAYLHAEADKMPQGYTSGLCMRHCATEIERRMKGAEARPIEPGEFYYAGGRLYLWKDSHIIAVTGDNGCCRFSKEIPKGIPVKVTITVENA